MKWINCSKYKFLVIKKYHKKFAINCELTTDILRLISIENFNRLTDLSTTFPLLWSTCWSMHETFDLNL